jgi:hypothetical protein
VAATAPPRSASILRLRTVGMSMPDGETASLHIRIPLWNGSLISSTSGQRVTRPWPGASCTVQRPGSLPGSIRPPAMGPSHSRSDQKRGLAHAWYEIMVIFDPDTEEHTVQPRLERHLR